MLKLPAEMRKTKTPVVAVVISALVMVTGIFIVHQARVRADAPSVVINEIHYHPNTGNENFEFLELYNRSNSSVDLSGWCFTAGISLCFDSGKTIASHGYVVVSPDEVTTLIHYQVQTAGTYTGNLSNSGESVTLRNAANTIVNKVTYSDSTPWPVSPDGSGPSLELKDPDLDNTLASSWGASLGGSTPGRINSLVGAPASPELSELSQPSDVISTDTPVVTVRALGVASVTLSYKLRFESDQSLSMHDDGTGGDTTPGDHIYSATLPAQSAGSLVRYKVTASNNITSSTAPDISTEGINYKGYLVRDSSVTSNLPILQWFIPDADYTDMVTNHVYDDAYFNCVLVYDNQVFDNTSVRIKGEYNRSFPKKSLKFNLPKSHTINIPGHTQRPISEFHMNAEWLDDSKAFTRTAWEIAEESGVDVPSTFGTRLVKNGQYYGYYLMAEKYTKEYREEKGYTGSLYEDFDEKITNGHDMSEIISWRDQMLVPRTPAKRQYVLDNNDIPNIINFMALQAVLSNEDWYGQNNLFTYKDTHDTNRWSLLPWDLDLIFSHTATDNPITPYVKPGFVDIAQRHQSTPLYDELDLREMYYRRLRTLADKFYGSDRFLTLYRQNVDLASVEAQLDVAKWGTGTQDMGTRTQQWIEWQLGLQKTLLLVRYRLPRAIPAQQTSAPHVTIEQVNSTTNADEQFIKLHNSTGSAIDMSGWRLNELDYTLPAGSVIASGGDAYLPRNDTAFRQSGPGRYVIGQLSSDIPLIGSMTLLRDDSSQSDSMTYIGS